MINWKRAKRRLHLYIDTPEGSYGMAPSLRPHDAAAEPPEQAVAVCPACESNDPAQFWFQVDAKGVPWAWATSAYLDEHPGAEQVARWTLGNGNGEGVWHRCPDSFHEKHPMGCPDDYYDDNRKANDVWWRCQVCGANRECDVRTLKGWRCEDCGELRWVVIDGPDSWLRSFLMGLKWRLLG